jgi:hypothetical protein
MISNKATPPTQMAHGHKWQTLIELTLPGQPNSIHLAADLVVETVQTLNLAAAPLEQLNQAVATAIQNFLKRIHLNSPEISLIIRVFISADKDEPGAGPDHPQAGQVRQSPAHGWSFFLVQKQADDPPVGPKGPHHLIELFLYQESYRLFR